MTAFIEVLANLFWPFVISAAAWAIAVCALTEPSELSRLIKSLTKTEVPATSAAEQPSGSTPTAHASETQQSAPLPRH